jgi:hypothetical protein
MRIRNFIFAVLAIAGGLQLAAFAQAELPVTYNATVVQFGSGRNTRTTTNTFQMNLRGVTSEAETNRLLAILAEGGQDDLLKEIDGNDLGNISIGGRLGPRINAVNISEVDGKKRIIAIFSRWLQFSELRGGYRSVDYPFGYVEIFVDPRTGRGEGTYIGAAQIKWKRAKNSNDYQIEVESFATFPGKLMGVSERRSR